MHINVHPGAVYAELEDGAVILQVETGTYFGLDHVGSRIWALIGAGTRRETIVDRLESEFAVDRTRLESDVHDYIRLLESKQLVVCASVAA